MTDPVDTDALRDMGAALTKDGHLFGSHITAAADEVDRLRAEADDVYRDAYRLGQQHSGAEMHKQRVAALRAVIENAPHADDRCYLEEDVTEPGARISPSAHCTCWKADVL